MMTPLQYCQQKVKASQSSFLMGFRFLPLEKRHAMTILYAFCRELDDVVDDCSDAQVAYTTLQWWRADLQKVFTPETPEHPVQQALKTIVVPFGLPQDELQELINGMEMDLQQARYRDFADLQVYCYRVAGVVGRLIARILGFRHAQTLEYAQTMGLALQLTNIIRDVGADARMGRIYLPIDELERFGVTANQILRHQANENFENLMNFQVARARETYRQALALLSVEDESAQKAGLIMASIYYALLQEIVLDGVNNVLKHLVTLPNPRKMRIALRTYLFGFRLKP